MRALVVPTAKLVGIDLQTVHGPVPPVLVPLRTVPLLASLIQTYESSVDVIYVLVHEGADQVVAYLEFFPHPKVDLVEINPGGSLADTISDFIVKRPEIFEMDHVIINLGDTLTSPLSAEHQAANFVAYADTQESARWTLFRNSENAFWEISDKQYREDISTWHTFLGVWGFRDFSEFASILNRTAATNGVSHFYIAITEYFAHHAPVLVKPAQWIDYGHADNLNIARREAMNHRSFNSMSFERGGSSIKKSSQNTAKLIDEIEWVLSQPDALRPFTPTIYSYDLAPDQPWVEMEFYPYPSLDECLVFARHDLDVWERIFNRVFEVLDLQGEEQLVATDLSLDLKTMYIDKPRERIAHFLDTIAIDVPIDEPLYVNGVKCPSLLEATELLPQLLESAGALRADAFVRLHGDLCFGNILYDTHHHLLKMIDPRGRFGRNKNFGDSYYDLAKLSHSVHGKYDFIVLDQFSLHREGEARFELKFRERPDHGEIARMFERKLADRSVDARRVRLIETTLFLSMLPLHSTRPDHQMAMLLRGLSLLAECVA